MLLNVPDTINDAKIKELMLPYGELIKITLRPDHQGAVVEYKDVNAAGRASLKIEGHEIALGRKLRVGTFEELMHESEEIRDDKQQTQPKKSGEVAKARSQLVPPTAAIRRPLQRGGRRGGLGFKRSHGAEGEKSTVNGSPETSHDNPGDAKTSKSNEDFKAMFAK